MKIEPGAVFHGEPCIGIAGFLVQLTDRSMGREAWREFHGGLRRVNLRLASSYPSHGAVAFSFACPPMIIR